MILEANQTILEAHWDKSRGCDIAVNVNITLNDINDICPINFKADNVKDRITVFPKSTFN